MATYNISVLATSSSGNGYRFSGNDKNGTINSSTNNPTININAGDTINFTFSNSTSHPFTIGGTTISGESATGGYYSTPTSDSYTFSSAMTYTYVCNVHSSMTGSIIAASSSGTTTTTTAAPTTTTTTTTTATTAAPTTTTTTTTTTTAAPTTTTTTTSAPDGTATTTTTASPSLTTTTTTTTSAPSTSDSGWVLTGRRSDLAKDPSTFFTFASNQPTDKFITDIELETQKVNQTVSASDGWVEKTPTTRTGSVPAINDPNRRRINNIDTTNLSVGMLVTGNNIPGNTVITNIDNNSSTITVSNAVEGESSDLEGALDFVEYIPPKRVKMTDLPYIDYVSPDNLPSTCSTSVSCNFNKVINTPVRVEGPASNLRLSVFGHSPYTTEVNWSVSMRQRVIRLRTNEDGTDLIDIPTSQVVSHQVFMGHDLCDGDAYDNNKPTSSGPVDIPPEPEFEGGEMNATQSQASMTKTSPYAKNPPNVNGVPISSSLTLTGGGDKEVTAVVTIREGLDFSMMWDVPATPQFRMEYSEGSSIDRVDYDLYGYSFEVKDPIKSGWRQFVEYTADMPAPSGCEGQTNPVPKFVGFSTQFGGEDDRGEDQTVIRGHSGRVYIPGETLIASFQSFREVTDWVEVDPSQEPHIIEGIGPYRGKIEFERSREYIFRVRAIYKSSTLLKNGQVFTSTIYTEPGGESRDYWVKQSYNYLGGIYRARNSDFASAPLSFDGQVFDAFDDDSVPDVPNQEPEFPEE